MKSLPHDPPAPPPTRSVPDPSWPGKVILVALGAYIALAFIVCLALTIFFLSRQ